MVARSISVDSSLGCVLSPVGGIGIEAANARPEKSRRAFHLKLTLERLRELLDYNPETGRLVRRSSLAGRLAGSPVGSVNADGYLSTSVDKECLLVHRLVWLHVHGRWPDGLIDHANGDKTDNRIENLRECTNAQNLTNRHRAPKHNKSGLLGVSFSQQHRRWRAYIGVDGKTKHLGYYSTPEQADAAYQLAKHQFHPFQFRPARIATQRSAY